ncbi:MAG TPA: GNAT family N-acetyltransferase [Aeromicrobium sp.]|nr:GNAT family N-acetyltransferase [Aeromicrobium sp.]
MNLVARPFAENDAADWDAFVDGSVNGTLLHTRRYLGYHRDRFVDRSMLVHRDGSLVAVIAAAHPTGDDSAVVSHPGITYGGLVHGGSMRGSEVREALEACLSVWACERFTYKAVPAVYHRMPAVDDVWALFTLGARRTRCDLSWAVDLTVDLTITSNRKRGLARARKADVTVSVEASHLAAYWQVLEENLAARHQVRPVHTVEEMAELFTRCSGDIELHAALIGDDVVAGIVVYRTPHAWHAQYIASSALGRQVSALDAVVAFGLERARANGAHWYDFGISNDPTTSSLNEGLYAYKSSYGGGSVLHEHLTLP